MSSVQQEIKRLRQQVEDYGISASEIVATKFVGNLEAAASSDLAIGAVEGKNITVKMGDASGANKVSFIDSASAEQANIDSDGLITAKGFAGPLTGDVTAASKSALTISNAAANKDIILNLGDKAAATKISITDSDDTEVASIDSTGGFDAVVSTAPMTYDTVASEGAPTNAECISAFGAADSVGAGFMGILKDSEAAGKVYLCVSDGAAYHIEELTAATTG